MQQTVEFWYRGTLYKAANLLLCNHTAKKSVRKQFVSVSLPDRNTRIDKKMSNLNNLNEIDPDSEDVLMFTSI